MDAYHRLVCSSALLLKRRSHIWLSVLIPSIRYHTAACLLYIPEELAAASILLAASYLNDKLPSWKAYGASDDEARDWWEVFDVDIETVFGSDQPAQSLCVFALETNVSQLSSRRCCQVHEEALQRSPGCRPL